MNELSIKAKLVFSSVATTLFTVVAFGIFAGENGVTIIGAGFSVIFLFIYALIVDDGIC